MTSGKYSEFSEKNNLFGLIKYWAAYSVLMLHFGGFWRIYRGYDFYVERLYERVVLFPPVIIFLSISGYIIAGSLDRCDNIKEFFIKRIKRIYIPLWISTAVYLIVYLIIAREYIDLGIIPWIITGLLGVAYTPSCLEGFASGSANGVLWTITILIELYVVTGLTWKYIRNIPAKIWGIVILPAMAMVNILLKYLCDNVFGSGLQKLMERTFFPYAVFFFIGVSAYLFRNRMRNLMPAIGAAAGVALLVFNWMKMPDYGYYTGIIRGLLTSVAVIGIGSWSPDLIGDHGLAGLFGMVNKLDITYETYLYQWLVINVFIYIGYYRDLEWYDLHDYLIYAVVIVAIVMRLIDAFVIKIVNKKVHVRP